MFVGKIYGRNFFISIIFSVFIKNRTYSEHSGLAGGKQQSTHDVERNALWK